MPKSDYRTGISQESPNQAPDISLGPAYRDKASWEVDQGRKRYDSDHCTIIESLERQLKHILAVFNIQGV